MHVKCAARTVTVINGTAQALLLLHRLAHMVTTMSCMWLAVAAIVKESRAVPKVSVLLRVRMAVGTTGTAMAASAQARVLTPLCV